MRRRALACVGGDVKTVVTCVALACVGGDVRRAWDVMWRNLRAAWKRGRGEPRRTSAWWRLARLWGGVVLGIGAVGSWETATRPAVNDRPDARAV